MLTAEIPSIPLHMQKSEKVKTVRTPKEDMTDAKFDAYTAELLTYFLACLLAYKHTHTHTRTHTHTHN